MAWGKGLDIADWRLRNQRIAAAGFKRPGEVVAWMGAVQAQDYLGALWALGLRMKTATEEAVEQVGTGPFRPREKDDPEMLVLQQELAGIYLWSAK